MIFKNLLKLLRTGRFVLVDGRGRETVVSLERGKIRIKSDGCLTVECPEVQIEGSTSVVLDGEHVSIGATGKEAIIFGGEQAGLLAGHTHPLPGGGETEPSEALRKWKTS